MNLRTDKARIERAMAERLFLVEWTVNDEFYVMGSTGNIYRVYNGARNYQCTCPDNMRRRFTCKHIIFILQRLLNIPVEYIEDGFIPDDVFRDHFAKRSQDCPRAPNNITEAVLKEYNIKETKGKDTSRRKEVSNDQECCICMEGFALVDGEVKETLDFCSACGNNFHKLCIESWMMQSKSCPLCRARWEVQGHFRASFKKKSKKRGYLNLERMITSPYGEGDSGDSPRSRKKKVPKRKKKKTPQKKKKAPQKRRITHVDSNSD